ncbi:MAG: hypothetical protein L0G37_19820, partial [Pseudomonas sp.]|nr:hypothetical protein [Pseudomonas sp.]
DEETAGQDGGGIGIEDHHGGLTSMPKAAKIKCGSWLSCESGRAVIDAVTDTPSSQASQLPHLN